MRTPVTAALAAALSFSLPADAASDADLAEIRAQVRQMRETYEQRIAALESRLAEAELGFSANVDDKIYANLSLSLSPDNSVEVEEAYDWERQAAALRGVPILVQHKAFAYLEDWLGLKQIAALEPKPGVEPTIAHLSEVLAKLQQQPVKMVLRAAYQSDRASQWIAERARINAVVLPFTVGGDEAAKDLFSLFEDTIQRLLKGAQ